MVKIAYFNSSSGIAGDMILASCISAGLSREVLEKNLKDKLRLDGWSLEVKEVTKKHFPALSLNVSGRIKFGTPGKMKSIIAASSLSGPVKTSSLKAMDILVNAEAKVHRLPPDKIHFHELNSIDTLVDIAGSSLALDMLGINEVYSSPLNLGKPAPATVEIVKAGNVPVYSTNPRVEMTTPTGAAIISAIAKSFGGMPPIRVESSGSGAGTFEFDDIPNILGLITGQSLEKNVPPLQIPTDEVKVLETNIDDMDPRIYPYVMDKLFGLGARDVWLSQVIMKKGRPGTVLSVICTKDKEKDIVNTIFRETTTLGIRSYPCSRHVLKRETGADKKTAFVPGSKPKVKSEYEKAREQAVQLKKPLKNILL